MLFKEFWDHIDKSLTEVFKEVDSYFEKPSDVRKYRPKNRGWTINEIVEHISLTNHFLLILINKGKERALEKPYKQDTSNYWYDEKMVKRLEEIGKHQSFPWERPEHMEPKGESSLEEVRSTIKNQVANIEKTLQLLKNGEGLDSKTKMSVQNLGKLDVYQYIYFLIMHAKRHIEQMRKNEEEFLNGKSQYVLNPSLKANIQDSLHFLMEINREVVSLNTGTINQDEFIAFIKNRGKEWGYISDYKHTFKILEEIKQM